jgi:hypothetical protein
MLKEYVQQLSRIPARVVVVAEPTTHGRGNPHQKCFLEDMRVFTQEYGLIYWDLHDALPTEYFLTTAHLHRRNHIRMANILADRLEKILGDRNAL